MDTSIKNKISSCPASERRLWIDYMDQLRKDYMLCHPDYKITEYGDNPQKLFSVLGKPIEKSTILTHLMLEPTELTSFEQKKQRLEGLETCSRMMGQGLYLMYPYKKIGEKRGLDIFERLGEEFPKESKKKYEKFVVECILMPDNQYQSLRFDVIGKEKISSQKREISCDASRARE